MARRFLRAKERLSGTGPKVECARNNPSDLAFAAYSHSIVAGGLPEMS